MFETPLAVAEVRDWTARLADARLEPDDVESIDLLRALEELGCAAAAAQAVVTADFDDFQRAAQAEQGFPAHRQGRGVAAQVALARRESPHRGQQHLGLAKVLRDELPLTMAAFRAGRISEWKATLMARETACLTLPDRQSVDAELGADPTHLEHLGDGELVAAARALAYRLDPAAVVARRRRAEQQRRVTLRPAPDVMTHLTALLPVKDGVAVHAVLTREADRLTAAGDPRSRGQIMADTLTDRILHPHTSRTGAESPRVMLHLTVPDTVLLGDAHDPGHLHGYGPVPADLVRELADTHRTWVRRLYTRPETATLVAADSTARRMPAGLARLLRLPHPLVRRTHPPRRPRPVTRRARPDQPRQRPGPLRRLQPRQTGPRLARPTPTRTTTHRHHHHPDRPRLHLHRPTGPPTAVDPHPPRRLDPGCLEFVPVTSLREGARVALLVPGSQAYLDAALGLLAEGVVPIPLDPRLTPYERDRILTTLVPDMVVDNETGLAGLPSRPGLPRARPMHVTSGTTGVPKGVWSGLLGDEHARALVAEERDLWGFDGADVHLVLSPLYHSAPLRFAMGTVLAGGRVVIPGPFDPARVTAAIASERPTSMFCVPTHLQRLFAYWDEVGAPDLSCFRLVAHAGAPCPDAVKRRLVETFPPGSTWEFYGSTEGQFTACRSEEWLARPGTVGRARPGRRLHLDDDGTIWCAVPEHARFSYYGDPGKTAAAWRGDAFTVGDLGRRDEDGYLWLDGRRTDLIISGGVNVYPLEVEQALREHPGVADVAVYGVADGRWGQRVCAAVVGTADEAALAAFARERLAPPKRPKTWTFLDDLPRTLTGKVLREQLSRRTGAGTAEG